MDAKSEKYPLTLEDAAKELGVPTVHVRRFAGSGKLASLKTGPLRDLRFSKEDIDSFKEEHDPSDFHAKLVEKILAREPHYNKK